MAMYVILFVAFVPKLFDNVVFYSNLLDLLGFQFSQNLISIFIQKCQLQLFNVGYHEYKSL